MKLLLSHQHAARSLSLLWALLPFLSLLLCYAAYFYQGASIPGLTELLSRFAALLGDGEAGYFWRDAGESFTRVLAVAGASSAIALVCAVSAYCYPLLRVIFHAFFKAMALLPLFFFLPLFLDAQNLTPLNNGVMLLALTPLFTLSIFRYLNNLPAMQRVKAQTLHASNWLYMLRIVLPQALAFQWHNTRHCLPLIMLWVLSCEALVAANGLGFRVIEASDDKALVMIYTVLTALLVFLIGLCIKRLGQYLFPWFQGTSK